MFDRVDVGVGGEGGDQREVVVFAEVELFDLIVAVIALEVIIRKDETVPVHVEREHGHTDLRDDSGACNPSLPIEALSSVERMVESSEGKSISGRIFIPSTLSKSVRKLIVSCLDDSFAFFSYAQGHLNRCSCRESSVSQQKCDIINGNASRLMMGIYIDNLPFRSTARDGPGLEKSHSSSPIGLYEFLAMISGRGKFLLRKHGGNITRTQPI